MNTDRFVDAKEVLRKELGDAYPRCREEILPGFLLEFANYIPGADEEDYDDFREYERDKYSSEQWAFICKMCEATGTMIKGKMVRKTSWEEYIDWVVDNYFPELA